jgi:predicted transcriptional regulator
MNDKEAARKRTELLKNLRTQHPESVARAQDLLKDHKRIQQQICQAIRSEPHSVPEISEATGLPGREVLWHVTALKKYGQIQETGMCGSYYLYQMVEGKSR